MIFEGRRINGWTPAALKRAGVSYFPQGSNIFPHMTVEENLRLSCWVFRSEKDRVRKNLAWARELFPVLSRKWQDRASLLSGGEAKMLSLAKEIVSQPTLMLVDEPSAGLAPKITEQVYEFLAERRREGATILLVDQNVSAAGARLRLRVHARHGPGRAGRAASEVLHQPAPDHPRVPVRRMTPW